MFGASCPEYVVDCIEVRSGDTVVVEDAAGTQKAVRVHGIDAPENGQPYGRAAEEAARAMALGERAEVDVVEDGRDGSLVARVLIGGRRLGAFLVRHGYAWHDPRQAPGAEALAALQREARANGRGLWSQETPIPPWTHREGSVDPEPAVRRILAFVLSVCRTALGALAVLVSHDR